MKFITEASFREKNIGKVSKKYAELLSKELGSKLYILGKERFKKESESGVGVRFMAEDGQQVRINYSSKDLKHQKEISKILDGSEVLFLSSIDYWEPSNADFEEPTSSLNFLVALNVIDIYKNVAKFLKSKNYGKYKLSDLKVNESLSEALPGQRTDKETFARSKGYNNTDLKNKFKGGLYAIEKLFDENGWTDEYIMWFEKGKPESNEMGERIRAAEKKEQEILYSDPKFVFDDLADMAEFVATKSNKVKSFICCGIGGVGKTFGIKKRLNELLGAPGDKWTYHAGTKMSALAFYLTMFHERNKVIVLDEADMILQNEEIVIMLKPGIDTDDSTAFEYTTGTMRVPADQLEDYCLGLEAILEMGGKINPSGRNVLSVEEVCDYKLLNKTLTGDVDYNEIIGDDDNLDIPDTGTKKLEVKLPNKIPFKGKMIFISNMPSEKIDQAIMSRSLFVDVKLTNQDKLARLQELANYKYKQYNVDEALQAEINSALGIGSYSGETDDGKRYMSPELVKELRKQGSPLVKEPTARAAEIAVELALSGNPTWKRLVALYA